MKANKFEEKKTSNVVYINDRNKEKTVSYSNSILLLIGWVIVGILSLLFSVFVIINFAGAINDLKAETEADQSNVYLVGPVFALIGESLQFLLFVIFITISWAKSFKYYLIYKQYKKQAELERVIILNEIENKNKNNITLNSEEKKIFLKEEKITEKDEKIIEKESKKKEKDLARREKELNHDKEEQEKKNSKSQKTDDNNDNDKEKESEKDINKKNDSTTE